MGFLDVVYGEFSHLRTLWDAWGKERNFWRSGNGLHACLEFAVAANKAWGNNPLTPPILQDVRQMIDGARATYLLPREKDGSYPTSIWRDDFGWWGIAWLRAYQTFPIFGPAPAGAANADCYDQNKPLTANCCLQFADDCFTIMLNEAWDKDSKNLPVSGGCWNDKTSGIQNTVTNALFLTLSIRLYAATKGVPGWDGKRATYLNAFCDQFRWFVEWMLKGANRNPTTGVGIYDYQQSGPTFPLLYWLIERPLDGADSYNRFGAPPYGPAFGFTPPRNQYWCGDQGLFLAGLIGLIENSTDVAKNPLIVKLDQEVKAHGYASSVAFAEAVHGYMLNGFGRLFAADAPHVLHEAPMSKTSLDDFSVDYAVGKGVLMRYLAFAANGNTGPFTERICQSAAAIRDNPPDPEKDPRKNKNRHGLIWDDRTGNNVTWAGTNENGFAVNLGDLLAWDFSIHTARLDGLTAAIPWAGQIK